MRRNLLPLIAALTACFASMQVQAQSAAPGLGADADAVTRARARISDGSSSTITVGESINSLTTRASVSSSIIQSSSMPSGESVSRQTASVGGARSLTGATGTISAEGTISGNLLQTRTGSPGGGASEQLANVGGVAGALTAINVNARGLLSTTLTQSHSGGSRGTGDQTVDIGGVRDSSGGSLTAFGVVSGDGINQNGRNRVAQELFVGSIADSNLQAATTSGSISGRVQQTTSSGVLGETTDVQRIGVADIRASQAASVTTQGSITGTLTQTQPGLGRGQQSVEVGSVSGVEGAGSIVTNGLINGNVVQTLQRGQQRLLVAAVVGGSPDSVNARATLTGDVTQSSTSEQLVNQRIAIGSVEAATGHVSTDATVGATISQTMSGNGFGRSQHVEIANAEQTSGFVNARAVVGGSISQSSQTSESNTQRISIGSVRGTAAAVVTTDATVTGIVTQVNSGRSRETQNILIGGVIAN